MLMLLATSFLQRFGDLLVGGIVLGMVVYGAQNGLFLAVLAGMHALVTLVASLAFAGLLAELLVAIDVPVAFAFPVAFGLLVVGTAVGIRLSVGACVPRDTLQFAPLIDKIGGGITGAVAGMIVAGMLLITFSIMPIPAAFRIDGSKIRYDLGAKMLRTFAHCVEPDGAARGLLLDGEQPPKTPAAGGLLCSELFVDVNDNGKFDDETESQEPFLDADGDGTFTKQLPFEEGNATGRREAGLLEYYRLGSWRNVRVMHSPAITSADSVLVPAEIEDGGVVYQATATDLDPGDVPTYAIRVLPYQPSATTKPPAVAPDIKPQDEGKKPGVAKKPVVVRDPAVELEKSLAIDATTGTVTLVDTNTFNQAHDPVQVVLTVTDAQGLTAEKTVLLRHQSVGKKKKSGSSKGS